MQFLGEPTDWVETARYLGVTLNTRLTCYAHENRMRKKAAQRLKVLDHLLNKKAVCPPETVCFSLQAAHPSYDGLRTSDLEVHCLQPRPEAARFRNQLSSHWDQHTLACV
jgi:hypothetical protein